MATAGGERLNKGPRRTHQHCPGTDPEANRKKLAGVSEHPLCERGQPGATEGPQPAPTNLLNDYAPLDLRPTNLAGNDVIGDAYEYLIDRFAGDAGKKAGEFYTPRMVSTLLAKLVEPQSGIRIATRPVARAPCC